MAGPDDLRALWREQPTKEVPTMSIEELKTRSDRLAGKVSARKWRETIAGAVSGAFLVAFAVRTPGMPLAKLAIAVLVLGEAVVLAAIWRKSRRAPPPPDTTPAGYLAHHRDELIHERNTLASVASWYLAPMLPGLLFLPVAVCIEVGIAALGVGLVCAAFTVLVCAIIVLVNRQASRKLAREIEALGG